MLQCCSVSQKNEKVTNAITVPMKRRYRPKYLYIDFQPWCHTHAMHDMPCPCYSTVYKEGATLRSKKKTNPAVPQSVDTCRTAQIKLYNFQIIYIKRDLTINNRGQRQLPFSPNKNHQSNKAMI